MIPARLTGKPFWDLYLYNDPPLWEAYIACAKHFDIDPLEIAPMGDCDLAELKQLYGDKIVLNGNLHTTDIMLRGSVDDVIAASKQAIDDAAEGGRFILSTGDQCGRDTPDENLHAMVETARTYGRY
jgi:uroporphyrinogen decarboxylase